MPEKIVSNFVIVPCESVNQDNYTYKLPDEESNYNKTIMNGAIEQIKSEIRSNRKIIPLSASSNHTFRCRTKVQNFQPTSTYTSDDQLKDMSFRSSLNKKRGSANDDLPVGLNKQPEIPHEKAQSSNQLATWQYLGYN